MSSVSINEKIHSSDNDWTDLEPMWRNKFTDPISGDVWNPPNSQKIPVNYTTSVIIPAWNAEATIAACLASLELSTLQQNYHQNLQVIVVDDGSSDGTWQIINDYRGSLNLLAVRQDHNGQSSALNTGIEYSDGNVIVFCDADMLLNTWALEELVLRHQFLDKVLLVGFRGNIDADSPEINAIRARDPSSLMKHAFITDNRFSFDHAGWPENMFVASKGFRTIGFGRKFWMPSGAVWDLPRMVYGCLFSLLKNDILRMGKYDERLGGWGFADTMIGAKAISMGLSIIPVVTANGWHVKHPRRSASQKLEAIVNQITHKQLLDEPALEVMPQHRLSEPTVESSYKWAGSANRMGLEHHDMLSSLNSDDKALKSFAIGDYPKAASLWEEIYEVNLANAINFVKTLRLGHRPDDAIKAINAISGLYSSSEILIEHALVLADLREFRTAHQKLIESYVMNPLDRLSQFVISTPSHYLLARAKLYLAQGDYYIAGRDCQAALMQDPNDRDAFALLEMVTSKIS